MARERERGERREALRARLLREERLKLEAAIPNISEIYTPDFTFLFLDLHIRTRASRINES